MSKNLENALTFHVAVIPQKATGLVEKKMQQCLPGNVAFNHQNLIGDKRQMPVSYWDFLYNGAKAVPEGIRPELPLTELLFWICIGIGYFTALTIGFGVSGGIAGLGATGLLAFTYSVVDLWNKRNQKGKAGSTTKKSFYYVTGIVTHCDTTIADELMHGFKTHLTKTFTAMYRIGGRTISDQRQLMRVPVTEELFAKLQNSFDKPVILTVTLLLNGTVLIVDDAPNRVREVNKLLEFNSVLEDYVAKANPGVALTLEAGANLKLELPIAEQSTNGKNGKHEDANQAVTFSPA